MLINNGDGTFILGPADIICIYRLPDGRYHLAVLEERPMPGPIKPIEELSFIRLKSSMHHTSGAETIQGAQEHIAELRKKVKIEDANIVSDVAIDMEDPVSVILARN